jgi:hypothetical protein
MRGTQSKSKFMMSLNDPNYSKLRREAKHRGISLQELIRVVVIPRWLRESNGSDVNIDIDKLLKHIQENGLNKKRKAVTIAGKRG